LKCGNEIIQDQWSWHAESIDKNLAIFLKTRKDNQKNGIKDEYKKQKEYDNPYDTLGRGLFHVTNPVSAREASG
jgi:hypothetical protein